MTFGIGLAALGRPGYMTLGHAQDLRDTSHEGMFAQTCEVLDAAYAAGIRHLDTARSYGTGEAFAARWIAARGHRDVLVSSKWGYRYTAGWQTQAPVHEVKDLSVEHLEAQWEQSYQLLGENLRIYQIHSATLESGVLDDKRVMQRLARLRKHVSIGVTATGPNQAGLIRKAAAHFDWIQATWNLLEPSAGEALAEAHARGVRIICKEALANGHLTERGGIAELESAAAARGLTPDALALGAALAQPFIDVVLLGAATVAQLQSNLQAAPQDFALAPWSDYWERRKSLPWT